MTRGARRREPADEPPELEIWFPGPDGRPIEPEPPRTTEETLRDAYRVMHTALDRVKDRGPAPGFRPGGFADRPARQGRPGEVFTSLLVRPAAAVGVVSAGGLFDPPLRGVTVHEPVGDARGEELDWAVVVRTGLFARSRATLRLRPTPSANLTILELVPHRLIRWRVSAFERVGVAAVAELAARLRRRSEPELPLIRAQPAS